MKELSDLLTIVIPVKNEEKNLLECLEYLRDFEYVVLADSGSNDRTLEIFEGFKKSDLQKFGKWMVVQFVWNGKFPKKRNWVLRNCEFRTPWVMFLDADERVTEGWKAEMREFLNSKRSDAFDVLTCFYDNWFMGRMLRHGDVMRKTAVMRPGAAEYEWIDEKGWSTLDMEIHEQLQPKRPGAEGVIAARLEHHDHRSLEAYYAKHEQYAKWEANRYRQLMSTPEMFAKLTPRQKKKYLLILKPWFGLAYFCVCYFAKFGFLDGHPGFIFARSKMRYFRNIRRKILNGVF